MEIPMGGFIGKTVSIARRVQKMKIPGHATNAGYFIVLSVFPALVLILSLLRYTPLDAQDLLHLLEGFLPAALMDSAERLIVSTFAHTSGTMVSVSAIGALWSASRGIYALLTGLNTIYDVEESRGYWHSRLLSVGYTFLFGVVLVLTLVLNVFGEEILQLLPEKGPIVQFLSEVVNLRFFLLLILQIGLFAAIFMWLPSRKNSFSDSLPGAALAALGWLIFTNLFSVYVEHFAGYTSIYGNVYAVALSMLWLYCCLSIVFYGGALNKLLMDKENF